MMVHKQNYFYGPIFYKSFMYLDLRGP